jgi:uncharacterized pyridoxamine 5'-phosphate oxidase family protein
MFKFVKIKKSQTNKEKKVYKQIEKNIIATCNKKKHWNKIRVFLTYTIKTHVKNAKVKTLS